jgi:hypothetical protein
LTAVCTAYPIHLRDIIGERYDNAIGQFPPTRQPARRGHRDASSAEQCELLGAKLVREKPQVILGCGAHSKRIR